MALKKVSKSSTQPQTSEKEPAQEGVVRFTGEPAETTFLPSMQPVPLNTLQEALLREFAAGLRVQMKHHPMEEAYVRGSYRSVDIDALKVLWDRKFVAAYGRNPGDVRTNFVISELGKGYLEDNV